MSKGMCERIDYDRCDFLGTATTFISAAHVGALGFSKAHSTDTKASRQPAIEVQTIPHAGIRLTVEGRGRTTEAGGTQIAGISSQRSCQQVRLAKRGCRKAT